MCSNDAGRLVVAVLTALTLAGCAATPPSGPTLTALPGPNKDLNHFQQDDYSCRNYASRAVSSQGDNSVANGVGTTALATAGGAAAGALLGAGSHGHSAGNGAAVGAGLGMLVGGTVAAGQYNKSEDSMQQQYDNAYAQCITSRGDTIMVPQPTEVMVPAPVYVEPAPRPYYYYGPRPYY